MICALTDFEAHCGLRDPRITSTLLTSLCVPQLDRYAAIIIHDPSAAGRRELFSAFITLSAAAVNALSEEVVAGCTEKC